MRPASRPIPLVLAGLVLAATAILLASFTTRIVPWVHIDRGVYISVAQRLLRGDRLYTDVYDNKDPLFYYWIAAQHRIGGWGEWGAELLAIAATGISALAMARAQNPMDRPLSPIRAFILLFLVMFVVTGRHYDLGGTFPPGIALATVAMALAAWRKYRWSGVVLAALFFTKATLFPIPALFIAALEARNRPALIQTVISGALAGGAFLSVLGLRGELLPYLATQLVNYRYSQNNIMKSHGFLNNIGNHLATVWQFGWGTLLFAGLLLLWLLITPPRNERQRAFRDACIAIAPLSLAFMALLVIWTAHVGLLYPFLVCALALAIPTLGWNRKSLLFAAAGAALLPYVLHYADLGALVQNPLELPRRIAALDAPSYETQAFHKIIHAPTGSYAKIGDDDFRHAVGLDAYRLQCPDFHPYPFYSADRLADIAHCAEGADFLIVRPEDHYTADDASWLPARADVPALMANWHAFYARVNAVMARSFVCVTVEPDDNAEDADDVIICRKKK